jgi:hypothetical protein
MHATKRFKITQRDFFTYYWLGLAPVIGYLGSRKEKVVRWESISESNETKQSNVQRRAIEMFRRALSHVN